LPQAAPIHGRDEIQHGSPGAADKTVKDVLGQIRMERLAPVAAVNGAAAPILIPTARRFSLERRKDMNPPESHPLSAPNVSSMCKADDFHSSSQC
jgi:hypothetical protein